jgi:hypothetical protein
VLSKVAADYEQMAREIEAVKTPIDKPLPWKLVALFFTPWVAAILFLVANSITAGSGSPIPDPASGRVYDVVVGGRFNIVYVDFPYAVLYWASMSPLVEIGLACSVVMGWALLQRILRSVQRQARQRVYSAGNDCQPT